MKHYVLGFLFHGTHGEIVALIKKARPPWQAGRYNGIGGNIEADEVPKAAMVREFREETQLDRDLPWFHYGVMSGPSWQVELFEANTGGSSREPPPEIIGSSDEPVLWWRVSNLNLLPTIGNVQFLIHAARDYSLNPQSTFQKLRVEYG